MSEEIRLIRRVPKDDQHIHSYEDVNASALGRPTILIFGGNSAVTPKKANGYAKIAQMLVTGNKKEYPDNVQIVSAQYTENYKSDCRIILRKSGKNPHDYCSKEVKHLFEEQFMPLLSDNTGTKLPLDKVKRNLRNINIITHSYGGFIALQIGNAMRNYMNKINYAEEEIIQAMQQISLLTLGNVADIENTKNQFTVLHIFNNDDPKVSKNSDNLKIVNQLANNNELASIDGTNRQMVFLRDNNAVGFIKKDKKKNIDVVSRLPIRSEITHKIYSHTNYAFSESSGKISLVASETGKYLNSSVNNSVENSKSQDFIELPTVKELLERNHHQATMLEKRFNNALDNSMHF